MRYKNFPPIIEEIKPKKILEIGTCKGYASEILIKEAQKYNKDIEYYGFDLFDSVTEEDKEREDRDITLFQVPDSLKAVKKRLKRTKAKISLFKGNSIKTLPEADLPEMDLIFIDGGHSVETIRTDWENIQRFMGEHTVVVFDDYWNRDDYGAKPVINSIDRNKYKIGVLPVKDNYTEDGKPLTVNQIRVQRRQ